MEQVEEINRKGKVVNNFSLNSSKQEVPLSRWNVSLVNRYYLANQRQGTSKVKNRGEVNGSTRKIYRQKGTGGARHGHRYAPQFRGGGVAFGPRGVENHSLNINKKLRKNVFQSLLGEKMRQQGVIVVDKIELENYKTKEAKNFLNSFPSKDQKSLIILGEKEENKEKIIRSFRNLPYISVSDSRTVNPSQVLSPHYLIFTQSAFSEVEKRLS